MQQLVFFWWAVVLGLGGAAFGAGQAQAATGATIEQADGPAATAPADAAASVVTEQPPLAILPWLEGTALSVWVNTAKIGYPTLLYLHVLGLSILVGTLIMTDLRLLNVVTVIPYSALGAMIRFAWAGFVINIVSGFALFAAQATTMASSVPFLTKITLVLLGAITTVVIQRHLRNNAGALESAAAPGALRGMAALSILIWLGAIAAGRLIPYLS